MSDHIFVKTLEEARRIAPNAKLVKDSSGSDIPCHPYEVCLCEATDPQIVEHDRKAEITRLIRGDYFLLLLGNSPEAMEKREKYGLKKGSTRTSASILSASYIDPFACNPVGGDDIRPFSQKGYLKAPSVFKPITEEELRLMAFSSMSEWPADVVENHRRILDEHAIKERYRLGRRDVPDSVEAPRDSERYAGVVKQVPLPTPEGQSLEDWLLEDWVSQRSTRFYHAAGKGLAENQRLTTIISDDPESERSQPTFGSTDPGPEEILVGHVDSEPEMFLAGQVNGKLVWDSVFGDVAPSPGHEELLVVGTFPAESGEMISIVVPGSDTPVEEMSDSDWWAALDKDCGAIRGKATVLTPAEHDALANLPGEPDEQP